jgi:hypothetical protein
MEEMEGNVLKRVLIERQVAPEKSPEVEDVPSVDLKVGRILGVVLAPRAIRILFVHRRQLGRQGDWPQMIDRDERELDISCGA